MGWWNPKAKIPIESEEFGKIVQNLVFECPSSNRHEVSDGKRPDGKKSRSRFYQPVSARNASFRARGISGDLLLTILGEIKRPLKWQDRYIKVEDGQTVEEVAASAVKRLGSDAMKRDLLVFAPRSDMPDTEAIFYYIRNAFAHGSFEVQDVDCRRMYLLESDKKGKPLAMMRLSEQMLLHYAQLAHLSVKEIKNLRQGKHKRKRPE